MAATTSMRRVRPGAPVPGAVRPLLDALVAVALGALLLAATEAGVVLHEGYPYAWLSALFCAVGLGYVLVGLAAWRRRPSSRLGALIVLAGGALLAAELSAIDAPVPAAVAAVTQTIVIAVVVHLLLAFPTGRLRGRAERAVVVAGYGVCTVLQAPIFLTTPGGPLAVAARPDLARDGVHLQRIVGSLVVLAAAAILLGRVRRADARRRRVLLPLSAYGILTVLAIPTVALVVEAVGAPTVAKGGLQLAFIAFVPVAFLVAASRGGFERSADLAELGTWLAADEIGRPGLRDALARTLGDPSLELLFRVEGEPRLVGAGGVATTLPERGGRGVVEVELGRRPVGAIVFDPSVLDRPEEVREAGRVVALALERERLAVELLASRARVLAAADDERRRIARDLHDGLQSRLVFLAVQAGAEGAPAAVRTGLQAAIDELRELVDGVMPAALTERGLVAAVEDLRDRLPMPTELRVEGLEGRLPADVETGAYFVVSEAMVNAVKHADPTALSVTLRRAEGRLDLEVRDDGGGGADAGAGLSGMADRVHALGGRLEVDSPAGAGTRVAAVIPCAS